MIESSQIQSLIDLAKREWEIITYAYEHRNSLSMEVKSDWLDFATETDMQVEKNLSDGIRTIFPNALILGEETGLQGQEQSDALIFVIDPIDGTKYFKYGMSLVTLSIGVLYKWESIFGLIYNPLSGDIIYGGKEYWVFDRFGKVTKPIVRSLRESQIYYDTVWLHEVNSETQEIWKKFISNLLSHTYRARTAGASCLYAFGAVSGLISWILDVFGAVKITDRIGYSAILQALWFEEREVTLWNITTIWLAPWELLDELQTLI